MLEGKLKQELRTTGVDGIFFILNLPKIRLNRWLVDYFFGKLLANLIEQVSTFDQIIELDSMVDACRWLAGICGAPVDVQGADRIPAEGPVLLAANHPGYFDTMVIAANLPRQDLKVLVGGVPYFINMPNTRKHIIYTDTTTFSSVKALRHMVHHLRSGGIALIYPTGQADPDPDGMPGGRQRFKDWSESVSLILRRVPETKLVPTVVSGILNAGYLRHLFARVQPNPRYRQRVAEFFQMYAQFVRANCPPLSSPRVSFGPPVAGRWYLERYGKNGVMPAVIEHAQLVFDEHMSFGN